MELSIENTLLELEALFGEAKNRSEFEFILTLINFRGMGRKEETSNLYEWFEAIEFYKKNYAALTGKDKSRIGLLLYSTFFENSDFYNIIGSLCRISLGFRGSSYLYFKTEKHERLLGTGQKIDFILELLNDCNKQNIITFFSNVHYKEIRNAFFHSAYVLIDDDFIIHDSAPIYINGIGNANFNVESFLYPKVDYIISFFDSFKKLYLNSFNSYQTNKVVNGYFPNPIVATIIGSSNGLKGFLIKDSVSLFDKLYDSGIIYDERFQMWTGLNITYNSQNIETIEIKQQLTRYEGKADINKTNFEFQNLVDKVSERKKQDEVDRIIGLLIKFGNVRFQKMSDEINPHKKASYPKIILPYYKQAVEFKTTIDLTEIKKKIKELEYLK
ncbi:MAG TPA: hypothetical protein VNW06_03460 [Cytophagaceae bacterium]|jgi:hypothetical protein|nr:hypothetical protein [Cytophagaceae bacterium]